MRQLRLGGRQCSKVARGWQRHHLIHRLLFCTGRHRCGNRSGDGVRFGLTGHLQLAGLHDPLALLPVDPGTPAQNAKGQPADQGQQQHPPALLAHGRHIDGTLAPLLALFQILSI